MQVLLLRIKRKKTKKSTFRETLGSNCRFSNNLVFKFGDFNSINLRLASFLKSTIIFQPTFIIQRTEIDFKFVGKDFGQIGRRRMSKSPLFDFVEQSRHVLKENIFEGLGLLEKKVE